MNIQDIIDAATPGPWWTAGGIVSADNKYVTSSDPYVFQVPLGASWENATFAATFDPEHVALMEAVCEAARDGIPCQHEYASSACLVAMLEDSLCTTSTCNKALCAALAAIAAYRKEHGL